jgi:simple sugar transport system ATP-binding protein
MLGHELSDIYPPRPPHGDETLLRVEGLHDDALLKDISCTCARAKFSALPGWRARENRTLQSAVWRQQKPRRAAS